MIRLSALKEVHCCQSFVARPSCEAEDAQGLQGDVILDIALLCLKWSRGFCFVADSLIEKRRLERHLAGTNLGATVMEEKTSPLRSHPKSPTYIFYVN